jgi:outer membrane receptor protein involved in Fe transport
VGSHGHPLILFTAILSIGAAPSSSTSSAAFSVRVHGHASPRHGAGDVTVDREMLETSPHALTGELLSTVPGMFVDHEESEGVANDIIMRGFDFDHGGGIEARVGPYPINIPAHVHGQGYADLNFMIPEVVRSIHVIEGSYDPRQGDFALAGSAIFELGVDDRGTQLKASYGSFSQGRVLALWAPEDEKPGTFVAVSGRHTDGFGSGNRRANAANAIAQWELPLGDGWRLISSAMAYAARATLPGVVRQVNVLDQTIGYFDSYPAPFGSNQSVDASRALVGADLVRDQDDGARTEIAAFGMFTGFQLRENFSGSTLGSGQGDLDETVNRELAAGLRASHRFQRVQLLDALSLVVEPGTYLRIGRAKETQSFLDVRSLDPWERLLDANVLSVDAGAYLDADVRIADVLHLSGGFRADALSFSVDDALFSMRHSTRAANLAPRVSLSIDATSWLEPMLAYGEGFRSPSARQIISEGKQPLARSRSIEAGFRAKLPERSLMLNGTAFITHLDDELVFSPESGTMESEGASTRHGVVLGVMYRPPDWLTASLSFTFVRATVDHPDLGEARLVPQIPALMVRADVALRHVIGAIDQEEVIGQLSVGYTYLSERPITTGNTSAPLEIVNASASLRWGSLQLTAEAFNVLDIRYPDQELIYTSNWSTGAPAEARHIIAAAPRTVLLSAVVRL